MTQDEGKRECRHPDAVAYLEGLGEEGAAMVRPYEGGQVRYRVRPERWAASASPPPGSNSAPATASWAGRPTPAPPASAGPCAATGLSCCPSSG